MTLSFFSLLFPETFGKCPEILTIFVLKHAHLPRIMDIETTFSDRDLSKMLTGDEGRRLVLNRQSPEPPVPRTVESYQPGQRGSPNSQQN
jgi:hypothetical protein